MANSSTSISGSGGNYFSPDVSKPEGVELEFGVSQQAVDSGYIKAIGNLIGYPMQWLGYFFRGESVQLDAHVTYDQGQSAPVDKALNVLGFYDLKEETIDDVDPIGEVIVDPEPFQCYRLEISGEKFEQKTYDMQSLEDEQTLIETLVQYVNENHEILEVDGLPERSSYQWNLLNDQDMRTLEAFETAFEVFEPAGFSITKIGPKIKETEDLEDGIIKRVYENGVEEEVEVEYDSDGDVFYTTGIRRFPDGMIEKGRFLYGAEIQSGYRLTNGEYTFFNPKRLGIVSAISNVSFIEVEIDDKVQLIPVSEGIRVCKRYEGDPKEALFIFAKNYIYGNVIKDVLTHKGNAIDQKDFIDYAFSSDEKGIPRVFALPYYGILGILNIADDYTITVDVGARNPSTDETLFSKWLKKGNIKLVEKMLAIAPKLLKESSKEEESFFATALLTGSRESADVILKAMDAQGVERTERDEWLKKASENSLSFKDKEFNKLDPALKKEIYQVANMYFCGDLVKHLNALGMGVQEAPFDSGGLGILAPNMDVVKTRDAIHEFLIGLREQDLLMAEGDFYALFPNAGDSFFRKDDIGRILGRNYIENTAQKLHLKTIKVPRKIAVIDDGLEKIDIKVDSRNLEIMSDQLSIYSEEVKKVDRKLTRSEMEELVSLLEETGYHDIALANFIIAEDGVYLVDTEFTNFSNFPRYDRMRPLSKMMGEKDQEWLADFIENKYGTFRKKWEASDKEQLKQAKKKRKRDLEAFGFRRRYEPFIFDVRDILPATQG